MYPSRLGPPREHISVSSRAQMSAGLLLCEVSRRKTCSFTSADTNIKILSQQFKRGLRCKIALFFSNSSPACRERRQMTPQVVCASSSSAARGVQSHAQMCPCAEENGPPVARPYCEIRNLQYGCLLGRMSLLTEALAGGAGLGHSGMSS